jgi:hypothetical protein
MIVPSLLQISRLSKIKAGQFFLFDKDGAYHCGLKVGDGDRQAAVVVSDGSYPNDGVLVLAKWFDNRPIALVANATAEIPMAPAPEVKVGDRNIPLSVIASADRTLVVAENKAVGSICFDLQTGEESSADLNADCLVFSDWSIVTGTGLEKIVLCEVHATPKAA